jgi:uncharacterized RDD family membrane protein YckC
MKFDEVELDAVPLPVPLPIDDDAPAVAPRSGQASRFRRLLSLLTDLSLFAAISLALSPLLPQPAGWLHIASLTGFVVVVSYYYFVGSWLLWGKTIGGTIFDVRVRSESPSAISLREATLRWCGVYLSLATAGIGFLLAALPSRRSLADRMSDTHCVTA